jgi:hypothetical protein
VWCAQLTGDAISQRHAPVSFANSDSFTEYVREGVVKDSPNWFGIEAGTADNDHCIDRDKTGRSQP